MFMIEGLLLRLIIGVLVYYLGSLIIGLIKDAKLVEILNVILIVGVVLYVIFGSFIPFIK